MAETFNPIISHLYSGQGGVSREITKYNNGTISEINVYGMQVVKNPDFSQGLSDYWASINVTVGQETDGIAITNNNNSTGQFLQSIDVVEGHTYLFKYTCYRSGGDSTSNPLIYPTSNLGNIRSYDIPTSMSTVEFTYVVPSGVNKVTARFFMSGTSCTIHCRDIYAFDLTAVKYDFGKLSTTPVTVSILKNTIKQPLDSVKFYGNTIKWNQLVYNGNFSGNSNWGVGNNQTATYSNNEANIVVDNGTKTNNISSQYSKQITIKKGHKYYYTVDFKSSIPTNYGRFSITDYNVNKHLVLLLGQTLATTANTWKTFSGIATSNNDTTSNYQVVLYPAYDDNNYFPTGTTWAVRNFMVIDLTDVFGAGNEPSTAEDFARRLRKVYYGYNIGEIISIEQASAYLYGLNIWDEEWEVGGYSSANGTKDASTNKFRSKNPFRVLPSTDYYATIGQEDYGYITLFYYDGANNYVGYYSVPYQGSGSFTTPANACFVTFQVVKEGWNNQYHNDICISLSNASTNGTYEASKGEQSMRLLSTNIYDRRLDTTNSALDSSGNITVNSKRLVSGYIDISGASYVSMTYGASYAFYNESKVFISGETKSYSVFRSYAIPSGAKYIRIDNVIDTISGQGIMMVVGQYTSETLPSYVPYGYGYATLNGVGDAVDTVTVNKNNTGSYVKSVGEVDLSTLTFAYNDDRKVFVASKPSDMKGTSTNNDIINGVCDNYAIGSANDTFYNVGNKDKTLGVGYVTTYSQICIKDDSLPTSTTIISGTLYYELEAPVETALTAEQCAEILNGAFTKSKYSTLLIDNDNGQIDQTVDVGMWEQR